MTPQRLKELAADPRFIPGIYNYCDRWCERCPFASRCLNRAMEEESLGDDPEARDLDNEKFWDALASSMKLAIDLIREDCEKRGIDFEEIQRQAVEQAKIEKLEKRRQKRKEHPLVAAAGKYLKRADDWLKAHKQTFNQMGIELESAARMQLTSVARIKASTRDAFDALEVIRWYYMFISAKLYRAVRQDEEEADTSSIENPETRDAVTEARESDANGSAKIALIGIDRSLAAWARLREQLPDQGDGIIDILVQLDRLRRAAEAQFPNARAFVRPGFDDGTPEEPARPPRKTKSRKRGSKDS